jgi:acetylornithine deacetylase/succinyl-diaminopimelate desuccinylase-like protein
MKPARTLARLLTEMIAIPSVIPEGYTGGTIPGENAMAAYVADYLRSLGSEVALQPVLPGRPNVVAVFPARDRRSPVVAIVPHLDTVGVSGMTISPFAGRTTNGRIYGRGACDTKGPMAAALWALQRCRQGGTLAQARVTWIFAATMGEEQLSLGANALCQRRFSADFAIVLEPTDLRIVHAAKGVLRLTVEAKGRAAHGSAPERGLNAVCRLGSFLPRCADDLGPTFLKQRHALLGPATLNVGFMQGGSEFNIVPDHARVGLDMRTHPRFDNSCALAAIRSAAHGLTIRIHQRGPSFVIDRGHPWVQRLSPHARGFQAVPWFSDANVLNAHGIPAVAFGPGSIQQAHTRDEHIEIKQLKQGAAALENFIRQVSSSI